MADSYAKTESQITIAINAINHGLCANVAEAACSYNVPGVRLQEQWKGQPSRLKQPGAGKKLTGLTFYICLSILNQILI